MRFRFLLPIALIGVVATSPLSARDPETPEQRISRLEKQVRQVQKQVFPKGQPADTAGFSDEPAATQSAVTSLSGRLDAIEQQMSQLVRTSEENGNRLSTMEAEVARLRADQDRRFRALENGAVAAGSGSGGTTADNGGDQQADGPPPAPQPKIEDTTPPRSRPKVEASDPVPTTTLTGEAGAEAAYDVGYRLWQAGKYDQAIAALDSMVKQFPTSRRVSWANNLAGRSLLDKGEPRAAAEKLLANYRRDPKGERAPDSLYYLGQSLRKLGQPTQACKAYAELNDVYGSTMRPALKAMVPAAMAESKCK